MSFRVNYLGLLLIALASAALNPAPAAACGNEIIRVYVLPQAVRRAERVERLIATGNSRAAYRAARELMDGVENARAVDNRGAADEMIAQDAWAAEEEGDGYGAIRETRHAARANTLSRRAEMLLAILVIRVDGQITRRGQLARSVLSDISEAHRQRAQATLARLLSEAEGENPRLIAYHAEAQGSEAHGADDALATLRDLGARDLVTDPLTWVALAWLESGAARDAALARCTAMVTRGASRVCRVSNT